MDKEFYLTLHQSYFLNENSHKGMRKLMTPYELAAPLLHQETLKVSVGGRAHSNCI